MLDRSWLRLASIAMPMTLMAPSASADAPIDPNAYYCSGELKSAELGRLQVHVFANKKNAVRNLEAEWWSSSKNPSIRAFWRSKDLGRGSMSVSYPGVSSQNRTRLEIGNCHGDQNVCGRSAHYAGNFRHNKGGVGAVALWGAVISIGSEWGDIYFQVQEDTGTVLREDKLPVSTLLAVEREMSGLIDAVEKKTDLLKDQC